MRVPNQTVKQVIDYIVQNANRAESTAYRHVKCPKTVAQIELSALQRLCDVDSDLSAYLRQARRLVVVND
jgi:hypothetical protein